MAIFNSKLLVYQRVVQIPCWTSWCHIDDPQTLPPADTCWHVPCEDCAGTLAMEKTRVIPRWTYQSANIHNNVYICAIYCNIYISPLEFSFTEMIPLILYHPLSNHIPSYRVPWFLHIQREPQEYWPIRCCKSWNQKGYERHQHFMKSSSALSKFDFP